MRSDTKNIFVMMITDEWLLEAYQINLVGIRAYM